MIRRDITGHRFGRLVAVGPAATSRMWKFKCDCGVVHEAFRSNVVTGDTQSCGCLRTERPSNFTHGRTGSKAYSTWCNMRRRCSDPSSSEYARYGGRGITVCTTWSNSFEVFLADMGEPPSADHSIDRIDNGGGYEPSNCRWASKKEQANNRSSNRLLSLDGKTQTLAQWCEQIGMSPAGMHRRLKNWPIERALTTPKKGCNNG